MDKKGAVDKKVIVGIVVVVLIVAVLGIGIVLTVKNSTIYTPKGLQFSAYGQIKTLDKSNPDIHTWILGYGDGEELKIYLEQPVNTIYSNKYGGTETIFYSTLKEGDWVYVMWLDYGYLPSSYVIDNYVAKVDLIYVSDTLEHLKEFDKVKTTGEIYFPDYDKIVTYFQDPVKGGRITMIISPILELNQTKVTLNSEKGLLATLPLDENKTFGYFKDQKDNIFLIKSSDIEEGFTMTYYEPFENEPGVILVRMAE